MEHSKGTSFAAPKDMGEKEVKPPKWFAGYGDRLARTVVMYLAALVLALPLFVIIDPYIPEVVLPWWGGVRVDQVLTFAAVIGAFMVLVRRFQLVVYGALLIALVGLSVTSIIGNYTFGDLFTNYSQWLRSLQMTASQVPMASQRLDPFHDAEKLRALVNELDPAVRKAAILMATANFKEVKVAGDEVVLVRALSIFKEINSTWTYVSDPKGREYFAPTAESIELMAGDCDDHAVLMAALISAVGGEVRLVRTTGHVYPELLVGNDERLERAAYLIRKVLFVKEVGDAPLYHHTDSDGRHWINLDYTRNYPGGELMNERIIGILEP
ncbi:MAG: hypothetical protein JNL52_02880 [Flavobacteriales bacterium]|nr:hypothetical protein [Flavobacteriales bacterium]